MEKRRYGRLIMQMTAMDHSVAVIGMVKNEQKYAMCCAWTMMVDYDKIVCLLGTQSVTGHVAAKGDIIGYSALSLDQIDVAKKLGSTHSDTDDKLSSIPHVVNEGAILIEGAKTEIKCRVLDVMHLPGIEEDNLLYLEMVDGKENEGKFLHMTEFI